MVGIILAAGLGKRMKAQKNKVYLKLKGKEVLLHTALAFEKSKYITKIIIVTGKEDISFSKSLLKGIKKPLEVIAGGETRQESSYLGVKWADSEYVIIHDGARPLVLPEDVDAVAKKVLEVGGAAVGTPCIDTMKRCEQRKIVSTVDRDGLYRIFTPQGFKRETLLQIHEKAIKENHFVTDDCALYEWAGEAVEIIEGNPLNIKITTPEDIFIAEAVLGGRKIK